jgi:hypothetical protein
MSDGNFLRGEIDTGFVERLLSNELPELEGEMETVALVAAAHLQPRACRRAAPSTPTAGAWSLAGRQSQQLRGGFRNLWREA